MASVITAKYNMKGIVISQEQANQFVHSKKKERKKDKKSSIKKGRREKICFQWQLDIYRFVSY